jgi:hypothetical protein
MHLDVIPLYVESPGQIDAHEIMRFDPICIRYTEPLSQTTFRDFLSLVRNSNEVSADSAVYDFRVRCVIKEGFMHKTTLYFNQWGDVLYNGKIHGDEKIREFFFEYIPKGAQDF